MASQVGDKWPANTVSFKKVTRRVLAANASVGYENHQSATAQLKIDLFLKRLGSNKACRHNLLLDWGTASTKSVFYPFKKLLGSSEIVSAAINRLLCLCFDSLMTHFLRLTHMGRTSSPSIFWWRVIGRNKTWNGAAWDQTGYYLKVKTCSTRSILSDNERFDWKQKAGFCSKQPETNNKFFLIQPCVTCSAQSASLLNAPDTPTVAPCPLSGQMLPTTDKQLQPEVTPCQGQTQASKHFQSGTEQVCCMFESEAAMYCTSLLLLRSGRDRFLSLSLFFKRLSPCLLTVLKIHPSLCSSL